MPKNNFVEYVTNDLLSSLSGVSARAMFGGYGIYKDDVIFAIIVDDELYFKVNETNRKQYEQEASEQFTYQSSKGPMKMSYWKVPENILENPKLAAQWAMQSFDVSKKDKNNKAKHKK